MEDQLPWSLTLYEAGGAAAVLSWCRSLPAALKRVHDESREDMVQADIRGPANERVLLVRPKIGAGWRQT